MSRPSFAIAAVLALAAAVSACSPQCTCPATIPAPAGPPPDAVAPSIPAPAAQPTPAPQPGAAGSVRIINDREAAVRMREVYPQHLLDVGVGADVVVEVTLDATGRVQGARDLRVSNRDFRGPALIVAHELEFTAPPAEGTVVQVRMRFRTAATNVEIVQP
jgi:hypothetical protein